MAPADTRLTAEQTRALAKFADNYIAGRRVLCLLFHWFVALGTLAGTVVAIAAFAKMLPTPTAWFGAWWGTR